MNLRQAMDSLVRMVTLTPKREDDDAEFVCIQCGAEHDRNYRECPECGRPYVTRAQREAGTSGKR